MDRKPYLLKLTIQIVAAYVSRHQLRPDELPRLLKVVYGELANDISTTAFKGEPQVEAMKLSISTVFPDHIICLEDGKRLKMLKRHLIVNYKLTPEQYRRKWNLPADYPMIAPNYAAFRAALAVKHGLGQSRVFRHRRRPSD